MRRFSLIFLLYIAVGVIFAVTRNQLSTPLLRDIVEALLYILLWPLTAFGLIGPINLSGSGPVAAHGGRHRATASRPLETSKRRPVAAALTLLWVIRP